ncbi:NAD(P)-dependent oxidoreductase [Clostridium sp. 'White wine YQ']|uniref:NAD(P)-dependent oxidoreductase n=1 Tax=Clostridium sp. 'White wine YQ' TaxID=3027474 RepID=UPI0023651C4E|nr:NAD(P)-dependent oxidoreductase [Clostridium sp. 'White wine YQ']MDD7795857.1 NAD(P)-dependent oxidoreductase [Clostridium sp. 'White wine YQ']
MSQNNREDIYECPELMFISLLTEKLKVGIIGAGKASFIKGKSFIESGCKVQILSKDFSDEVNSLKNKGVVLTRGEYNKEFIIDKHIIVIAVDDNEVAERIANDCDILSKIYIDCRNYRNGMAAMPVQGTLKNISFALNTKGGNPKAALMLKEAFKDNISEYDEFIRVINKIRERAKELTSYKREIIDFIATEDFRYMWQKKLGKEVLLLFFPQEIICKLLEDLI